jgi:hypothetical protein
LEQTAVGLPSLLEDVMEHKTRDEIRDVADILPNDLQAHPLSKLERLELWVEALECEGEQRLRTLFEIEYAPPIERAALRADRSPLSVAFADPRLRADGLAGDTIGDAVAFFGISELELHNMLCFCHHGETMSADMAAARVRAVAAREARYTRLRGTRGLSGACGAALRAVGLLPA